MSITIEGVVQEYGRVEESSIGRVVGTRSTSLWYTKKRDYEQGAAQVIYATSLKPSSHHTGTISPRIFSPHATPDSGTDPGGYGVDR